MRIEATALAALAALAAVAACAHAPASTRAESCATYSKSLRPSLARLEKAADVFGAHVGNGPDAAATASRELAVSLDVEHGKLQSAPVDRQEIADAHGRLLVALAQLADALRYLSDVVARRDEAHRVDARERFHDAESGWQSAVAAVKAVCPL